jgi:ABC-type arginine transport system permease subunit
MFFGFSDLNRRGAFDARILESLVRGTPDIVILLIYLLRSRRLLERVKVSNRHSCKRVVQLRLLAGPTGNKLQKYKKWRKRSWLCW